MTNYRSLLIPRDTLNQGQIVRARYTQEKDEKKK